MESLIRERMEEAWRDVKPWTARLGAFFLGAAFCFYERESFRCRTVEPLGRLAVRCSSSQPTDPDRNFVLPTVQYVLVQL